MKSKMFAIYDTKSETYGDIVYAKTLAEADRSFATYCNNKDTIINKYPADYNLFQLGEYDQQTGEIFSLKQPLLISNAAQHIPVAQNVNVN